MPPSVSVGEEAWRRRPEVVHETIHGALAEDTRYGESLAAWIVGENAEEDALRCAEGTLCFGCFTPYPVPLRPGNEARIYRELGHTMPHRPKHRFYELVRARRCPLCGQECSPEMFTALFLGAEQGPSDADP